MGDRNLTAVHRWWSALPDFPYRVLAVMAFATLDDDTPPVYYRGWEFLAERTGRRLPSRDDDDKDVTKARASLRVTVMKALRVLRDAGAIEQISPGVPGRNARYALKLIPGTGNPDATHLIDEEHLNG